MSKSVYTGSNPNVRYRQYSEDYDDNTGATIDNQYPDDHSRGVDDTTFFETKDEYLNWLHNLPRIQRPYIFGDDDLIPYTPVEVMPEEAETDWDIVETPDPPEPEDSDFDTPNRYDSDFEVPDTA